MPSTKEIPEVGTIYLYEDHQVPKSKWSKIPLIGFFRRKLRLDERELETKRKGVITKNGKYRVRYTGLNGYRQQYLQDLYVTLIDLKWRYALAIFFNIYLVCYVFFGVCWWIIGYNHGDFDNVHDPTWRTCVSGVTNFPKALLFSIETQSTIGWGVGYPNTDCDGTLFLLFVQITIGILIDNLLLGFIFVKFAQPKRRQNTMMFSKNVCVSHHEGELCLQIRVGDIRKSHLLAAQVHGVLLRRHVTSEGVLYPLFMNKIDFTADAMGDTVVLMWPLVLTHKITPDSPFWDIKPADLTNEKYELVVFIEGTIETTGELCQVRTSYTPREFLWGHRFDRIEEFDSGNARWEIDFAAFNDVIYTSNIRHSAKELACFKANNLSPEDEGDDIKSEIPAKVRLMRNPSYDAVPDLPPGRGALDAKDSSQFLLSKDADSEDSDDTSTNKLRHAESMVSFRTADDEILERGDECRFTM
ncbi:G protein-activated inward rectifier potassium channel 2-like [Dreissena polymorpha]|uniref:Uncharacterized protein n=1 Tax=Dreissena polymorpha TaxID=45954 RepID=A0A9D4MZY7_DREPO|nr:G protein-activated inward rectifier potassium channel 2-like [Dreissena polymorpha]KAH3884247.1 hypothetical protein DPMN_008224 [Dreissena polymorpha]